MKKQLFLLAIIIFSVFNLCFAQVTFQKSIGGAFPDWGNSVRQTTDGGYILTGTTMSGSSVNFHAYLVKTNANGDLFWTKTFYSNSDLRGLDIQQTIDGGYILLGSLFYYAQPAILIKTNATGDTTWTRDLTKWGNAYSVQQTTDSGYIITGSTLGDDFNTGKDTSNITALLLKTNPIGNITWSKSYSGSKRFRYSGQSVQQTNDKGYIVTGYTTIFGADSIDVYLLKTNADGDTLWSRTFGGHRNDYGTSVKQTSDDGYIITGYTNSFGAGRYDVYLIKTNSDGNIVWSKTYGGDWNDYGYSIQQTIDGGYIISGLTNSFGTNNGYLIKTDNLGNIEWSKTIGGGGSLSVDQTSDSGYIFTGQVISDAGNENVLLVKTDQMGNSGCNEADALTITKSATTKMSGTSIVVVSNSFTNTNLPCSIDSGIGTGSSLCTTVGLNEIKTGNSLLISPNPSSGEFVITFPGAINHATIEIYTFLGERVFSETVTLSSQKDVNLQNSAPGIYFVKILDGERRYSQKVMIE